MRTVKEISDTLETMFMKLKEKAGKDRVEEMAKELKCFATTSDLKTLYEKVIPQLSVFECSMQGFEKGHLQFQEMI